MKRLSLYVYVLLLSFILQLWAMSSDAQEIVDYRFAQSAVKNQKSRGTCTAFALCAALEVQPGLPSDLSEQYLYASAKFKRYLDKDSTLREDGEMLEFYIDILQSEGVISEAQMPYDTTAPRYSSDYDMLTDYEQATAGASLYSMFEFKKSNYLLEKDAYRMYFDLNAKDTALIKFWLREGIRAIPVSYSINEMAWQQTKENDLITLDSLIGVSINDVNYYYSTAKEKDPDILNKILKDEIKIIPLWSNGIITGGHAVTIVGFNEQGFIIKNSWGTGYGKNGYAIVSYDYHMLLCKKAMIINNFYNKHYLKYKSGTVYNGKDIMLKTYPVTTFNAAQPRLSFSFFYEGKEAVPEFSKVELGLYQVHKETKARKRIDAFTSGTGNNGYQSGYVCTKTFDGQPFDPAYNYELEARFTLAGTGKVIVNKYPYLEWRNKTVAPGVLSSLLIGN